MIWTTPSKKFGTALNFAMIGISLFLVISSLFRFFTVNYGGFGEEMAWDIVFFATGIFCLVWFLLILRVRYKK